MNRNRIWVVAGVIASSGLFAVAAQDTNAVTAKKGAYADPARFEKSIAAFETADRTNPPVVLILGSLYLAGAVLAENGPLPD